MSFFKKLFNVGKSKPSKVKVLNKLAFLEVDMHNHLLPGIDDGCQSVEESLHLLKGLKNLGFSNFICTPHVMEEVYENDKYTIAKALATLQKDLPKDLKEVKIYSAAEHMIDGGLTRQIEKDGLNVMPGGYVLIEMSYLSESNALFQVIYDIQDLGYKPILAHPERYNYYHQNFDTYKKIKNAGCCLQLNLLSISRYYGTEVKVAALTMIKSGMYDFVGTDIHHARHLAALEDVVDKYPVRDLLRTCNILNPTLIDHLDEKNGALHA